MWCYTIFFLSWFALKVRYNGRMQIKCHVDTFSCQYLFDSLPKAMKLQCVIVIRCICVYVAPVCKHHISIWKTVASPILGTLMLNVKIHKNSFYSRWTYGWEGLLLSKCICMFKAIDAYRRVIDCMCHLHTKVCTILCDKQYSDFNSMFLF